MRGEKEREEKKNERIKRMRRERMRGEISMRKMYERRKKNVKHEKCFQTSLHNMPA